MSVRLRATVEPPRPVERRLVRFIAIVLVSCAITSAAAWVWRGQLDAEREPDARTSIREIVERVRSDGPSEQRAALADGRVTRGERLVAVEAVRGCLRDAGVTGLSEIRWSGSEPRFEFDASGTGTQAYQRCYDRFQQEIDAVAGLQEALEHSALEASERERVERWVLQS